MAKVSTFKEVLKATEAARKNGKKIVATNGCFDLVHVGHVRNLEAAKKLGDVLVVGINSDSSVRTNKGDLRPIVSEKERAIVIAGLASVDHVFIFSGRTPFTWIQKLRPHIHVKGGGKDIQNHPDIQKQRDVVERVGGKLVFVPHQQGKSTTNIIEKVIKAHVQ